ncbi:MAG: carbohydrate kinase family protein [Lachnospiraceae bacterium]|nr:carbohydrate kinase family protein [Lachnospiraceae bacterium]
MIRDGIAVAGNLIVDYVKMVDTYAKPGMLCNILSRSQSPGGCGANTLGSIAAMDPKLPLWCCGCIGDDEAGIYIQNFLKEYGINRDGVRVKKGCMTSFTDVMTVQETGERTFFQARGANAVFGPEDLNLEEIGRRRMFHMGYALLLDCFDQEDAEYGTVMARTLAKVQSLGVKTSMDVVSEDGERFARIVKPSLKYCNYFIANEIEGGRIAGIEPREENETLNREALKEICKALMECGVSDLVVLHAPEGGAYLTKNGEYGFVPSLKLPKGYIRGSVGAGDAFCAGILYGLYQEYSMEQTMVLANGAAAANLSEPDSLSGLRPVADIFRLAEQYPQRAHGIKERFAL